MEHFHAAVQQARTTINNAFSQCQAYVNHDDHEVQPQAVLGNQRERRNQQPPTSNQRSGFPAESELQPTSPETASLAAHIPPSVGAPSGVVAPNGFDDLGEEEEMMRIAMQQSLEMEHPVHPVVSLNEVEAARDPEFARAMQESLEHTAHANRQSEVDLAHASVAQNPTLEAVRRREEEQRAQEEEEEELAELGRQLLQGSEAGPEDYEAEEKARREKELARQRRETEELEAEQRLLKANELARKQKLDAKKAAKLQAFEQRLKGQPEAQTPDAEVLVSEWSRPSNASSGGVDPENQAIRDAVARTQDIRDAIYAASPRVEIAGYIRAPGAVVVQEMASHVAVASDSRELTALTEGAEGLTRENSFAADDLSRTIAPSRNPLFEDFPVYANPVQRQVDRAVDDDEFVQANPLYSASGTCTPPPVLADQISSFARTCTPPAVEEPSVADALLRLQNQTHQDWQHHGPLSGIHEATPSSHVIDSEDARFTTESHGSQPPYGHDAVADEVREYVEFAMKIEGLCYAALTCNPDLLADVSYSIQASIIVETGADLSARDVLVELSEGSVVAHSQITCPLGVDIVEVRSRLAESQTIADTVIASLKCVKGVETVAIGEIYISDIYLSEITSPDIQDLSPRNYSRPLETTATIVLSHEERYMWQEIAQIAADAKGMEIDGRFLPAMFDVNGVEVNGPDALGNLDQDRFPVTFEFLLQGPVKFDQDRAPEEMQQAPIVSTAYPQSVREDDTQHRAPPIESFPMQQIEISSRVGSMQLQIGGERGEIDAAAVSKALDPLVTLPAPLVTLPAPACGIAAQRTAMTYAMLKERQEAGTAPSALNQGVAGVPEHAQLHGSPVTLASSSPERPFGSSFAPSVDAGHMTVHEHLQILSSFAGVEPPTADSIGSSYPQAAQSLGADVARVDKTRGLDSDEAVQLGYMVYGAPPLPRKETQSPPSYSSSAPEAAPDAARSLLPTLQHAWIGHVEQRQAAPVAARSLQPTLQQRPNLPTLQQKSADPRLQPRQVPGTGISGIQTSSNQSGESLPTWGVVADRGVSREGTGNSGIQTGESLPTWRVVADRGVIADHRATSSVTRASNQICSSAPSHRYVTPVSPATTARQVQGYQGQHQQVLPRENALPIQRYQDRQLNMVQPVLRGATASSVSRRIGGVQPRVVQGTGIDAT